MKNLPSILVLVGALLIIASVLLMLFPNVMRYPFAVFTIVSGAFLLYSGIKSLPGRGK